MMTSVFLIIARGIEFGDAKSQQWIRSVLAGFVSSIVLIEPAKVTSFVVVSHRIKLAIDFVSGNRFRHLLSQSDG